MTRNSTWSFSFRFVHGRLAGITGRAGRAGGLIPVGRNFPPSVPTDTGAHSASYTIGTGLLPGVMWMGHVVDHPFPSSVEVKERLQLYLYSPCRSSGPVLRWPLTLSSLGLNKPKYLFFPLAYHVTRQSHSPLFHDSNNILWTAQMISPFNMQFSLMSIFDDLQRLRHCLRVNKSKEVHVIRAE
jgi:hypothetical protein